MPVEWESDVFCARAQAAAMAREAGLDAYAVAEFETAVSELAGNVLHHAGAGEVWLRRFPDRLEVECLDRGPGFAGTAGRPPYGLGAGLKGVQRLLTRVAWGDRPGGGAWVRGVRVVPDRRAPHRAPFRGPTVQVALALEPRRGEAACGDVALCEAGESGVLIAVLDGLGHGEPAQAAALVAGRALSGAAGADWPVLLAVAHEAARATRGAVAGLLRLSADGAAYCGVGNVGCLDVASGRRLSGTPGCLGAALPPARAEPIGDGRGGLVLLFTDGLGELTPEAAGRPEGDGLDDLRVWVESLVARAGGRDDALAAAVAWRPGPSA